MVLRPCRPADLERARRPFFGSAAQRKGRRVRPGGLRTVSVGSYIGPGDKIVWLQKVDPIFADFNVTEADFGRIAQGEKLNERHDQPKKPEGTYPSGFHPTT